MKYLLALLLILITYSLSAQRSVSGRVVDPKGLPIPGVNVWIKGTYSGGTSDAQGGFEFTATVSDTSIVLASAIGYRTTEMAFSENLNIVLKESVNELSAVSITAGTIEVSDKATSMVMKPLDVVTTAGALADITGALNTLPGTATVANDGRLFVRGGDASETAIFFDGLRVGAAYGTATANLPTRNRFSPALFKGTFFSTGGYSAEFGDALSSVLVLETIDKPVRNQTDISFMTVGGSVAATRVGEKQSVTGEISYLNLAPYQEAVKQDFDWVKPNEGIQGQVVYRRKIGEDGMFKAFILGSNNKFALYQPQPGVEGPGSLVDINNNYLFGNMSYKKPLGKKLLAEGGLSLSHNYDRIKIDSTNLGSELGVGHLKQKLIYYPTEGLKITSGAEAILSAYEEENLDMALSRRLDRALLATFSEAEYLVSNNLTLRGGLRLAYEDLSNEARLEPRLAAALRLYEEGSLSFAAGWFSQSVEERTAIENPDLSRSQSRHLQMSFQHGSSTKTFRAEVYHKSYNNLPVIREGITLSEGDGLATGFDLFFRDRTGIKNLDYWITYSYVYSRREFGSYASRVQPSFAPEHNLSLVGKYWIADWKSMAGATFAINSGYTYDNPNLEGDMESVSPYYGALALNWSYLYRSNLIIHLACNNVLGRENVFGYRYATDPGSDGSFAAIELGQPAPRFFFIGVFWTISKDKQANQLNNL